MSAKERSIGGWVLFLLGLFVLVLGIWFNHYANFPSVETVTLDLDEAVGLQAGDRITFDRAGRIVASTPSVDPALPQVPVELTVEVDTFGWVPRDCLLQGGDWCLPWFTVGHLAAIGGSQLMLLGIAVAVFLGRRMTWSMAALAAFLAMLELVLLLGTAASSGSTSPRGL